MTRTTNETKFAVIAKDLEYIKGEVADIKSEVSGRFVTKEEFDPVKKIVYGLVTLILTAVVGALVGLVILR